MSEYFLQARESDNGRTLQILSHVAKLESDLDMQRDEFKRISALSPSSEIVGICERAIASIEQTSPVIVQRDKLQSDRTKLRTALVGLVGADSKEELDGMEMFIRINPIPDEDRMTTINAIHALRETLP